jgi:hypothetical protein
MRDLKLDQPPVTYIYIPSICSTIVFFESSETLEKVLVYINIRRRCLILREMRPNRQS